MTTHCELVNTYEILEHIMGISGLHPHSLNTIKALRLKLVQQVSNHPGLADGIVLDLGCGSGAGTSELAYMFENGQRVIGLDINEHAIDAAKSLYANQKNLSFFHGDISQFLKQHHDLKISGAISISVSMFLANIQELYSLINSALMDGGVFIDAPFMFKQSEQGYPDHFRQNTYAVCGCNMQMQNLGQIKSLLHSAGFSSLQCHEHEFDLMRLKVLFADYSPGYLLRNFCKNVISPPEYFGSVSSWYLFFRTMKIFLFFLRNRDKYASGEFVAVKT